MSTGPYIFGYAGERLSLAQMEQRSTWSKVHPELRRRVAAMFVDCPHDLGYGNGWRSPSQQEATFRSRYTPHSSPPGIYWEGQYWRKRPGMADSTPPGMSFHNSTTPEGWALAVDLYNALPAIGWANAECGRYGLRHFAAVNSERWHFQPVEIPTSRRNYIHAQHGLGTWPLPGRTPPTPQPPPPQGDDMYIDDDVLANVTSAPPVAKVNDGSGSSWLVAALLKAYLFDLTGSDEYDQNAANILNAKLQRRD